MTRRATVPTDCAAVAESNVMPPIPSEPATMPNARKSSRVGTPSRSESRLTKTPASSNTPATRIKVSCWSRFVLVGCAFLRWW